MCFKARQRVLLWLADPLPVAVLAPTHTALIVALSPPGCRTDSPIHCDQQWPVHLLSRNCCQNCFPIEVHGRSLGNCLWPSREKLGRSLMASRVLIYGPLAGRECPAPLRRPPLYACRAHFSSGLCRLVKSAEQHLNKEINRSFPVWLSIHSWAQWPLVVGAL